MFISFYGYLSLYLLSISHININSIGAYFILSEPWRWPELVATIISLTGVIFVARPPFIFGCSGGVGGGVGDGDGDGDGRLCSADAVGVLFGMIASITAGLAYVCVRLLGTSAKMPWYNVVFAQALGQVIFTIPNLYLLEGSLKLSLTIVEIILIVGGGLIGAWSQVAMTFGMQREKSASATAMRMSDVVFGFMWQVLFTEDSFSILSAFGKERD